MVFGMVHSMFATFGDFIVKDAELGVGIVFCHLFYIGGVLISRSNNQIVTLVNVVLHGGDPVCLSNGLRICRLPAMLLCRLNHGTIATCAPATVIDGAV